MRIGSWRTLRAMGALVALSTVAACGGDEPDTMADTGLVGGTMGATPADTGMAGMSNRWMATLEPQGGTNVTGTATVMPGTAANTLMAEVSIQGAPASGTHPWHVHAGTCGSGGDIVGPPADYPPLQADANGSASATATVNVAAPTTGDYHVNVHMSPTDLGTIVSCGNLRMEGM